MTSPPTKSTLVIHPDDRSTDFLRVIYAALPSATVVTGACSAEEVRGLIQAHDRVLMMGHGNGKGLFGLNYEFVIDSSTVPALRGKECMFIWCFANMFVEEHDLHGFYTGMFISEVVEAVYCGLPDSTSEEEVKASNESFSSAVAFKVESPAAEVFSHVMSVYGPLAAGSEVADYNTSRLRCR